MIYVSARLHIIHRLQELFPNVFVDGIIRRGVIRFLLEPDSLSKEDILMMHITFREGIDYYIKMNAAPGDIRDIMLLRKEAKKEHAIDIHTA